MFSLLPWIFSLLLICFHVIANCRKLWPLFKMVSFCTINNFHCYTSLSAVVVQAHNPFEIHTKNDSMCRAESQTFQAVNLHPHLRAVPVLLPLLQLNPSVLWPSNKQSSLFTQFLIIITTMHHIQLPLALLWKLLQIVPAMCKLKLPSAFFSHNEADVPLSNTSLD